MDIIRPTRHEQSVALGHSRLDTLLSEGLVGYWRCESPSWNGTAGEVKDSSGFGNHGTAQGGLSTAAGKLGRGSDAMNGLSHYINCGAGASLAITKWTIMAWVYRTAAGVKRLLGKSDATDSDYFMFIDASNYLAGNFADTGGVGRTVTASAPSPIVPLNKWAKVGMTFDGKYIRLYQDGALIKTSADFSAFTPRTSSRELWIGRVAGVYWGGQVDEVAIWNRALSDLEMARLYNNREGLAIL